MESKRNKFKIRKVAIENDEWKAQALSVYENLLFVEPASKHPHAYFAAYKGRQMAGHSIVLHSDGRWILDGLRVKPEHREQGIGKALTEARIRYAVSKGAKEIWYCCADDNLVTICCHVRFGFKKICPAHHECSPKTAHWYKLNITTQ
ncbi:MAG: GNAT family N-acetyltransferase [Elusimicrobia bacterium]|nr:GNAT family N-acetyltransferase [Elusimicrobiota bacterium]